MNLDKYDERYHIDENTYVQKIPRLEKFLGLFELYVREAFKKNNDETYGKFHILGGGISRGSFSICYHERF